MNTEPPTGDDLQRMLVTMKQSVLDRAEERRPAPRRRGRRVGIVIGVIAVLGLGATSGGVALGMIPQPFAAAPAPTAPPSATEPAAPSTPAAAPVQEKPDTVPTPTATPTKGAFALDDPSTWTISGDEVGPVALDGATEAESDDLQQAYRLVPATPSTCTAPGTWARDGSPTLRITDDDDRVTGVLIGAEGDQPRTTTTGPTTAAGIGVGSTSDALHAAYPSLQGSGSTPSGAWSRWDLQLPEGLVSFQLGNDGAHVNSVWVSPDKNLPTSVCDL